MFQCHHHNRLNTLAITLPTVLGLVLLIVWGTATTFAQTTQFTYQGLLNDGGSPASGTYDLQFRLFDAAAGGTQVGSTVLRDDVTVSSGLFKVVLDFGAAAFPGANRWLEIAVRPGTSTGAFTTLSPLQQLNGTPYAIRSLNAATAALADGLSVACVNCVTSGQINTVQGSQVTGNIAGSQINGAIPVASVPAGSVNYVQNTTTQQASANFNIDGDGTVGGTVSAQQINATNQYNLGGSRILSGAGVGNLFVGLSAGAAMTTGTANAFVGANAGMSNTSGASNSFFGYLAGTANTTGNGNSFFGRSAGTANTTGGLNSFFGEYAGAAQTTGAFNSFFGYNAGGDTTSGQGNAFFGYQAGSANTDGLGNAFFGAASGLLSTASYNAFFGHLAGWLNTTGNDNAYFGQSAGLNNTTGARNSFFGREAGSANTTGGDNAFFGRRAGNANTIGANNTIIGTDANVSANNLTYATALGAGALVSANNTVVLGRAADTVQVPGGMMVTGALTANGSALTNLNAANITTGTLATARGGTGLSAPGTAGRYLRSDGTNWTSSLLLAADLPSGSGNYIQNSVGLQAGANFNISGNGTAHLFNATTQYDLGGSRVLSVAGTNNLFAGIGAGAANTAGDRNSFFGQGAGASNTTGGANSFYGYNAGAATTTEGSNAFFGHRAGESNLANVNSFFGSIAGLANTTGSINSFFGYGAGRSNTTGSDNSFFGHAAGYLNITGEFNSFFGRAAGYSNTTANDNAFFGAFAGYDNTTGTQNAFFGRSAGGSNTTANDNAFFGFAAGRLNLTGSYNAFFGSLAGDNNTSGYENAFFGRRAGELNTTGYGNSFLGWSAGNTNTTGDNNIAIGHGADVGSANLTFATAIGAGAVVSTSNTIVLGRSAGSDKVRVPGLGAATATHLCIDTANQNELSLCSSSLRYKTNVATLQAGLGLIQRLRPVTFDWKNSNQRDLGLIAEEVAAIEPLLVTHNAAGEIQGVKYDQLSVVLINALQQQQEQFKLQQAEIAQLKQIVCALQPKAAVCQTR